MIEISDLSKIYSGTTVLKIPSLRIEDGESFGLVGNNGAGKTTLFRLILDIAEASTGEVKIGGLPIARRDEWKHSVGSFLDEGFLIDFLTPEEYFLFIGKMYGKNRQQTMDFLASMEELFSGEILGGKKFIRDLSKGNQKKVGIAAAMLGEPEILILDEPFTALDPSSQIRLKNMLSGMQATKGTTLLISSHDLNHITDVCQRIVVLEHGNIVKDIATADNTLSELESYFKV